MVLRPEVIIALATGRLAEFGFRGVVNLTRITKPLRCGDPFKIGLRGLWYILLFQFFTRFPTVAYI